MTSSSAESAASHLRSSLVKRRSAIRAVVRQKSSAAIEIVFLQEFGPEGLWRGVEVRPPFRREIHEIPIRPHGVQVIHHRFSPPEMSNPAFLSAEYVHHRQLHV